MNMNINKGAVNIGFENVPKNKAIYLVFFINI